MAAWVRGCRIVAMLVLTLMTWDELATSSMVGSIDAEAATEPARYLEVTSRVGRPSGSGPDALVARSLPAPSSTPTATPRPSPVPAPTPAGPSARPLGVFKVTGYSDSAINNGTDGRGITKSGQATRWGVVAVDPGVIPLGSKLLIDGMDSTEFTALDTGGGIKGNWVDVWFQSDGEAFRHGVKYLNVRLVVGR